MILHDIFTVLYQISRKAKFGLQSGTGADTSKYLILEYGIEDKRDPDVRRDCVFKQLIF